MTKNREKIIHVATELFCSQGIKSTGMQAIQDRVGVARNTLYHYFSSKEVLIVAVLQKLRQDFNLNVLEPILNNTQLNQQEKIQAFIESEYHWFSGSKFSGCPFHKAIQDYPDSTSDIHKEVLLHSEMIKDFFRTVLPGENEEVIKTIYMITEGAIISAQIYKDPHYAHHAFEAIQSLNSKIKNRLQNEKQITLNQ